MGREIHDLLLGRLLAEVHCQQSSCGFGQVRFQSSNEGKHVGNDRLFGKARLGALEGLKEEEIDAQSHPKWIIGFPITLAADEVLLAEHLAALELSRALLAKDGKIGGQPLLVSFPMCQNTLHTVEQVGEFDDSLLWQLHRHSIGPRSPVMSHQR